MNNTTDVRARLEAWHCERDGWETASVSGLSTPDSGVVNETWFFTVHGTREGASESRQAVLRIQPATSKTPIPGVDVTEQAYVLRQLSAFPDLLTPAVLAEETDTDWFGRPFYIMSRMPGEAVFDAQAEPREAAPLRTMYEQTIAMLARIHAVDWEAAGLRPLCRTTGDLTPLQAQLQAYRRHFEDAANGKAYPLLEETHAWLADNFPAETGPVLNWGDARIGNLLFDGTELTAVLDWEIAEITCREVDVGWFVFFERFLWNNHGGDRPGAPGDDDIIRLYEKLSGAKLADLDWFQRWAAFRLAVMRLRAGRFAIESGEEPADSRIDEINFASIELARVFDLPEPQ